MPQPPFRSDSSSSPRRSGASDEPLERTPFDEELEEQSHLETQAETESDDPFQPVARRVPRRHEVRPHQVRHHEVRRREVRRRETTRAVPVAHAPADLPRRVVAPQVVARRNRARRFVWRLVTVATILFAVQGVTAALSAPQFAVKRVEIDGLNVVPRAQIEPLAQELLGQNVFRADVSHVERAVEAIPTVADARVRRNWNWPPQMSVEITEREPVLRVGGGENWWVVDESGMAFRRANETDSHLYALAAPQLSPRQSQILPAKWWKRALELRAALERDNALISSSNVSSTNDALTDDASSDDASTKAPNRFWELRRLYFDRHGMASVRVSGDGELKEHRELLIRLGEGEWAPKLRRAREALTYFERTGRQAQELDLVSLRFPRWVPHPQLVNQAREREASKRAS